MSYVLLEKLKWSMLPQAQPLRTILFLELFALVASIVMAFELACKEGRLLGAVWWASAGLAVGIQPRVLFVLAPLALGWLGGTRWRWLAAVTAAVMLWVQPFGAVRGELLVTLGLGALLAGAAWVSERRRSGVAAVMAVVVAAFFVIPGRARWHWSGQTPNPQLEELARWARGGGDG